MFRWRQPVCAIFAGLIIASFSSAATAADPLTLFILRILRDQAITSVIEAGVAPAPAPKPGAPAGALPAPQIPTEGQWLKGLIDESFIHLGPQQRDELHASLQNMLNDPKNASLRSEIIVEFTRQAVAMRDAHRHLARLTEADMKQIAIEARAEFEKLSPEQRQQMMQALQHGVPGMPRALNELMLAEFNSLSASP